MRFQSYTHTHTHQSYISPWTIYSKSEIDRFYALPNEIVLLENVLCKIRSFVIFQNSSILLFPTLVDKEVFLNGSAVVVNVFQRRQLQRSDIFINIPVVG